MPRVKRAGAEGEFSEEEFLSATASALTAYQCMCAVRVYLHLS